MISLEDLPDREIIFPRQFPISVINCILMVLCRQKNNEQTDRNKIAGISGANIAFCRILAGSVFTEKW